MPAASYSRSAAGQAAYEAALREGRRRWRTVEDQVRVGSLGWSRRRGADGRLIAVRPVGGGWRRLHLEPNAYPYEVPAGVAHWILWSDSGAMTAAEVERYLEREAPAWASGWTWVRNPTAARSVPGIWHVQVFLERGSS
jgi:hypothetical protein